MDKSISEADYCGSVSQGIFGRFFNELVCGLANYSQVSFDSALYQKILSVVFKRDNALSEGLNVAYRVEDVR